MGTESDDLKAALIGLRKLKARVGELEAERRSPIAIVGMACRLPGADDVEAWWELLREGRDAVSDVPADRWNASAYLGGPDEPGTTRVRRAGFLSDIQRFDADFFGISHREARAMDPQQRLLLETAWHALEDAGRIAGLEGSNTGVFLGVALTDWDRRTLYHLDPAEQDVYAGTGVFNSVAAGRVSYVLGLRGPNISLDTACSSSLVAVHLAAMSLRARECDMALAGGVNLLIAPDATLYFDRMGALAPDGRCKAFDAAADGYVRAEGVGVVVLKRLDDALRDGDRVLAVLRGSAINQDGRSNGLTAPSPEAQKAVLRAALAQSGLGAGDVGLIEAHGTGTPLGDPIELDAVREVYGGAESACYLGAAKTNIGHAEAAAGVAGLLKLVQALRHREVPANLHFRELNPRIPLRGTRFVVPTRRVAWTERLAGCVSSFGMSGTNAHVVLTAAPERAATGAGRRLHLLPLSAPDPERVRALVGEVIGRLRRAPEDFEDAVFTSQIGRVHHGVRLSLRVGSAAEAVEAAEAWLEGGEAVEAPRKRPRLLGWWPAEGGVSLDQVRQLAAREPALAAILTEIDPHVRVGTEDLAARLAVGRLLERWGLPLAGFGGEGAGELVAAALSGALEVADALRLAAGEEVAPGLRARLWLATASAGGLVSAWGGSGTAGDAAAAQRALAERGHVLPIELDGQELEAALLGLVARCYALGVEPDWAALHPVPRRRVDWPRTRFAGPRLWIEDPVERHRDTTRADGRVWKEQWEPVEPGPRPAPARWVLGDGPLSERLAGALHGAPVVRGGALQAGDAAIVEGGDEAALVQRVLEAASVGARVHVLAGPPDGPRAALWGLGRVIAQERPGAWGGLLDEGEGDPEAVAAALARADGRDLALRGGRLHQARLVPGHLPHAGWRASHAGAWWVTGGLGAMGLEIAAWLADRGARWLVLSGRGAPSERALAVIDRLRGRGVVVDVLRGDVSRPDEVRRMRQVIGGAVVGVVHAAGVVEDGPLDGLDAARFAASRAAKVDGGRALAEATADDALQAFVLIGSASAQLGIHGQGAYAAANAGLGALAAELRRAGRPVVHVAFGPWTLGMAGPEVLRRLEALGIGALSVEEGLDLLGRALASPGEDRVILRLDPVAWRRSAGTPRVRALLGGEAPAAEAPRTGLAPDAIAEVVALELARVLGRADASGLDRSRGFFDLGLDSMTAVAFARALEDRLGLTVPPTVAFDHGDLGTLVSWLTSRLAPAAAVERPAVEGRAEEPVAIIGMACRFPGGDDPEAFWRFLVGGGDAIRRVPPDRWDAERWYDPEPGRTGKAYVREGAFLDAVDGFDAAWFGISPREAAALDPQQRLLLEVGVEAVEDAGLPLDGLVRSRTGVFMGIGPSDYGRRFDPRVDAPDPYAGTGNEPSFAAGRLAYALGVQGPTVGLNTACSTSLVTTHLACQALLAGECELALAGGVHLMLAPDTTIQLSQLQALSPTAHCHTFDAAADGYARGEGCGVLVLKRLSAAQRDGDRVLGVILASGVNHDGPSAGLTVPSGSAQQALLRSVLERSGLQPADVGLIEAHGTGTKLGDPIEVGAIKAVYGDRPADRPLRLTSVKTHVGHLELAAGVAGVIATVQSLRHGVIAPLLGFERPNPAMDLDFPVRLPVATEAWEGRRRAAVSSFGLSGTNAHLVLEEGPSAPVSEAPARSHHLLVLSGRSEAAVRGLAGRLAARVGDDLPDLAWTLAVGRSRQPVRAHIVARDAAEATEGLRKIERGATLTRGSPAPVVWMFTGQGAQRPGMGMDLYAAWPAYREVIDRCDAVIRRLRRVSLLEVLAGADDRVHDTAWTQPALFAVEAALAAWWRSLGLQPDAVIGHSIGELTAAWFAGVMELEDAVALVCERGRLMSELPRDGGMAQVALREDQLRARLGSFGADLDVAAVNAPDETVVSGDLVALDRLIAALEVDGVRCKRLVVSHAFHSSKMDPMLDAFEQAARRVSLRSPQIPVLSNLTARPESALLTEPIYWRRHVREAVRFADGLRAAPKGAIFLEVGPHPVLSGLGARVRDGATFVPSLRRDRPDGEALADAVGELWRAGVDLDLRAWDAPWRRVKVQAPTTPWTHVRHWVPARDADAEGGAGLLYRVSWRAEPWNEVAGGRWFAWAGGPLGQAVAEALGAEQGGEIPTDARVVDLRELDDGAAEGPELGVLAEARIADAVALVQACRAAGSAVTFVTRGVSDGSGLISAGLWGLARGLAVEEPGLAGGVVDLAYGDAAPDPAAIARAVRAGLPLTRVTAAGLEAPVLERLPAAAGAQVRGVWWVTGGLGAVGLAVAGWLVERGAARVVLTGRRPPSEEAAARIAALGGVVEVLLGDVAAPGEVERLLAAIGPEGLRGVVHAAGALADAPLRDTGAAQLAVILPPKVRAAWALHEATRGLALDAFVLLSSAAGTLGWGGQAAYGAANSFMDGLARLRRAQGLPATSLAYGPWAGGGMADAGVQARMRGAGMRALPVADGLGALSRALKAGVEEALVVDLDWATWVRRHPRGRGLAGGLLPAEPEVAPRTAAAPPTQPAEPTVRAAVAEVLRLVDPDAIDATLGLFELGLDSITALELVHTLRARLGIELPLTAPFEHPSIEALVALVEVQRAPVAAPTARMDDPVAIIGLGCRFPGGADDPDALWQLLVDRRDAVGPVPADRWDNEAFYDPNPGTPGRTYVREGGFLSDVSGFEPAHFGISPKEAARMDPQQRLLLEVCWEALEHAGIAPDRLRETRTGVIVGIGGHDYERILERAGPPDEDDGYLGTGNDLAFAAGRVAWHLGLRGPVLSLDTACSSSLVALHLAAEAVRSGEADLALAGGVRLMLSPESTLRLSALRALSPGARCRTFDAGADGYARGEGCGIVVLKRLADARRDGDRVLAVLAATAMNHDGPSSGLTVPSGSAQAELLRRALAAAGLQAKDVDALEAHGTGTALGDPIELGAVKQALGDRPADRPLVVGSIKTNLGHTELAAGVAGVIKGALALQHELIPAQLHFSRWNEAIDRSFPVRVADEHVPWPRDHRRVIGVSAFGLAGTNAHALLADPPDEAPPVDPCPRTRHVLLLGAATEAGVEAQASALSAHLRSHPELDLADVAATLAVGRARGRCRLAVVAGTLTEAADALVSREAAVRGVVRRGVARPKVALLFTGQGSQYAGMARGLYEAWPVVREVIDRCDAALRGLRGEGLLPVLFPRHGGSPIDQTAWTQPALFAVELAVAELWRSLGVEPDLVLGHSIGELAAATFAGMVELEDGLRIVEARGRLMQALPQEGAMGAIFAPEDKVRTSLTPFAGRVDVAAINGPEETVISGDADAVRTVLAGFEADGARVRELVVSHAFHSHRMDPMLDEFEAVVRSVSLRSPRIDVVSDLTAAPERELLLEPGYWRRHVREAVRFAPAVQAAFALGARWFIEVGPQPVLSGLGARTIGGAEAQWAPSLRRGQPDEEQLSASIARVAATGFDLELRPLERRRRLALPGTQFQRRRTWVDGGAAAAPGVRDAPCWTIAWEAAGPPTGALPRRWWVVPDLGGVDERIGRALRAAGCSVTVLAGEELEASLTQAVVREGPPDALLVACGLDAGEAPLASLRAGAGAVLGVIQAVARAVGRPIPLWVLTREAASEAPDPAQAAVVGLLRVLALEQRAAWGGLVDLGPGWSAEAVLEALADPAEDQARIVGTERRVARLVAHTPGPETPLVEGGAVLITGGLGAVGLHIAERLVQQGATALVLNGRRPPSAEALARVAQLRARGAQVEVVTGDVADEDDCARVVAAAGLVRPLQAVVHAAGVLDDVSVAGLDLERLERVARAKVLGAVHLERLTGPEVALVLLSSATAAIGAHGQGNYAAANAYLDALAARARAGARAAVSVAFGPWSGGGMAGVHLDTMVKRGIRPLAPAAALDALARVWRGGAPHVVIADADWATYAPVFSGGRARGLLQRLAPTEAAPTAPTRAQRSEIAGLVARAVAGVLGLEERELDRGLGFFELGLDSLMAVALVERLGRGLGRELPSSVVFDHPTVERLTAFLLGTEPEAPAAAAPVAQADDPVVIVGLACRFPGAPDADAFWALLERGGCAVGEAPRERWPELDSLVDPTPGTPGRTYTTQGAFLEAIDQFDAGFFGISPREAEAMDPQQRLLLEVCWEALEDAGVPPGSLRESGAGVYVGMGASEYDARFQRRPSDVPDAYSGTGNDTSFAAGRIAYVLGLHGPAMTVNTACSASLVSLHLAAQALRLGECDLALAGGVNLMVSSDSTVRLAQLRALSPTGRCWAFDAAADGYVRGEGAGVVVVERLSDARRHGHRVLAVVRGTGVNHDGPSSALTVPSGTAQTALLREVWRRAGVTPDQLGYIEAHGTGTRLGDPIEARALATALGARTAPLPVGSVKTNIGHLELAAGAAGLIKTVLALRHGKIPAHVGLTRRSADIPESLPLVFPTATAPWTGPRVAGVSSFGLSGTNAHVVLEGGPPDPMPEGADGGVILPLAARSRGALDVLAGAVATSLDALPLADVAYTAGLGRTAGHWRVAAVGNRSDAVQAALRGATREGRFVGEAPARAPKLVWAFTGLGSGYPGMGAALARVPAFAAALDEVDGLFAASLPGGARRAMRDPELGATALGGHTALVALQVALVRTLRGWGVEPDAVVGHGLGELVAAWAAGVWSLEALVQVTLARGRAIDALAPGAMASVVASAERVMQAAIPGVEIAAVNGAEAVVVGGPPEAVAALQARMAAEGVTSFTLPLRHAVHTSLAREAAVAVAAAARAVSSDSPEIEVASGLTGGLVTSELRDPERWAAQVCAPVRFYEAARSVDAPGAVWMELGPSPQLLGLVRRAVDARGRGLLATSRRDREVETLYEAVAEAWVRGVPVDFAAMHGPGRVRVDLPKTPFERRRHWVEEVVRPTVAPAGAAAPVSAAPDPLTAIRRFAAELLGTTPDEVPVGRPLAWLGLDSIMATDLHRRLQATFGVQLPLDQVLSGPSVEELAATVQGLITRR